MRIDNVGKTLDFLFVPSSFIRVMRNIKSKGAVADRANNFMDYTFVGVLEIGRLATYSFIVYELYQRI